MKRSLVALAILASACGGSSSTAPTPPPTPTATRIISISPGDLPFGTVNLGESSTRTFTIGNSGTGTLTFTGITASGGTGATGFTATPTAGSVAPGGTQTVSVRFAPTIAQYHSAVLTVTADQTAGQPAFNISGLGFDNSPLFVQTGVGDSVFTVPSKVRRMRIDASYSGFCQNFIVRISTTATSLVNVIIGTCSVADTPSPFSGTYAINNGGTVSITGSTGVSWTFTEVR